MSIRWDSIWRWTHPDGQYGAAPAACLFYNEHSGIMGPLLLIAGYVRQRTELCAASA